VVQPIGIRVGPWVSVRLNPFKNTISKIEINEDHIDLEIEILEDTYTYTSIEHRI
jgi:DNA-binding protein YbaB